MALRGVHQLNERRVAVVGGVGVAMVGEEIHTGGTNILIINTPTEIETDLPPKVV